MFKFEPYIKYKVNGKVCESDDLENNHYSLDLEVSDNAVKCVIRPKVSMEMLEFGLEADKKLGKNEVFFANGFQSWTKCYECHADDKIMGLGKITQISNFTKFFAGVQGDYHFTEYEEKGKFHSYTYTYFREGEKLVLFGSRSERNGYTIFEMDCEDKEFCITKDIVGCTLDSETVLVDVVCFEGGYDEVFDKYFGSMDLRKPKINYLAGYTSWYNYYQKINEAIILRDLDGLDRAKDSVSIFQIDDGYETFVGDWLDPNPAKFPHGMKYIADKVHDKGYLAGIWIAPFSVQRVSRIAKEHPDWLIKDAKGKPLLGCQGWGGAYTLDFYHPEAREYIRHFFDVIVNEWGFDMVKLDFLYSEAMFPRHGKTRGTIMCEAMDFLRECVGEEKLILGCGVPLGPSFGVVDACRIGCDVSPHFEFNFIDKLLLNMEIVNTRHAMNNTFLRRHLDQRVFCNDPDVFFLRDNNLKFTLDQKLLLAKINNLFGSVLFVSDNAGDYDDETMEYLKLFFKPSEAKVLSAEYVTPEDVKIVYIEDEKKKTLRFNVKTGKSNLRNLL